MKRYLLPETGTFYKANLHCHSTFSDGRRTPEEIKRLYQSKGYSVVAFTDHDILIPHGELTDDRFLALNGFEMEINDGGWPMDRTKKVCHLCFIGLEKENIVQPCWHRTNYLMGNAVKNSKLVVFDEHESDFEREYSSECINKIIKTARKKGFFVTYNHPTWSREDYRDYMAYEGMHAMEMMNGISAVMGYEDYNPRVYDDMLRGGKRLYCIGADDNHNIHPDESRHSDSGYAFTVIKADRLEYREITKALEAGHFYASEGPEILELYVENNEVHVKCADADKIFCIYGSRHAGAALRENDVPLTEAVFPIRPEYGYFRITVVDERGRHACTNAYFVEDYYEEI